MIMSTVSSKKVKLLVTSMLFVVSLRKGDLLTSDDYCRPKLFLDQVFEMFKRLLEDIITSQMNNNLFNLASSHVATLLMILVTFLMMLSLILPYVKLFSLVSSVFII